MRAVQHTAAANGWRPEYCQPGRVERKGGLILAHNIGMANDYDALVRSNRSLKRLYYKEGEGMAITLKKR